MFSMNKHLSDCSKILLFHHEIEKTKSFFEVLSLSKQIHWRRLGLISKTNLSSNFGNPLSTATPALSHKHFKNIFKNIFRNIFKNISKTNLSSNFGNPLSTATPALSHKHFKNIFKNIFRNIFKNISKTNLSSNFGNPLSTATPALSHKHFKVISNYSPNVWSN